MVGSQEKESFLPKRVRTEDVRCAGRWCIRLILKCHKLSRRQICACLMAKSLHTESARRNTVKSWSLAENMEHLLSFGDIEIPGVYYDIYIDLPRGYVSTVRQFLPGRVETMSVLSNCPGWVQVLIMSDAVLNPILDVTARITSWYKQLISTIPQWLMTQILVTWRKWSAGKTIMTSSDIPHLEVMPMRTRTWERNLGCDQHEDEPDRLSTVCDACKWKMLSQQSLQSTLGMNGAVSLLKKGAAAYAEVACAPVRQRRGFEVRCGREACGNFCLVLQRWRLRISRGSCDHVNGGAVSLNLSGM